MTTETLRARRKAVFEESCLSDRVKIQESRAIVTMPVKTPFAICIKNSGYLASLKLRKLYEVIDDPEAEKDDMLRVIDESGEDYLFPSDMFVPAAERRNLRSPRRQPWES